MEEKDEVIILKNKVALLESILDAIPFPVSATDISRNWLFINKATEKSIGLSREEALGKNCSLWNANICNTKDCGINCLERGDSVTYFSQEGEDYKVDIAYLYDSSRKKIGYLEVVANVSELQRLIKAVNEKQNKLQDSIKDLDHSFKMLSEGRFVSVPISSDDPLLGLKENANESIDSLKELVVSLKETAKSIASSVSDISTSSSDIAKATQQVASTVGLVNGQNQAEITSLEKTIKALDAVSSSISQVTAGAKSLSEKAVNVSENGKTSLVVVNETEKSIARAKDISDTNVGQIKDLSEKMSSINKIVRLITEIASQTNLLSLNAAIEAARAGEYGRGFAVVAAEVKSLANDSKKSAEEISSSIEEITAKTSLAVTSIMETSKDMADAVGRINDVGVASEKVINEATEVSDTLKQVAEESDRQSMTLQKVNQDFAGVLEMLEKGLKAMDELAALAEEVSASTEEIASIISEVDKMGKSLFTMTERFEV
ncbi:MAG: hypothetical protein MNSN_10460 [Minisyncoccus archaeiphilus]|uniref:methyl-accepting chemotaxis protein n=1 Tax=Minisyncoccus archaeiphilus TaxID=3238481 RepID=UPI002B0C9644|nr:MAG: hypothetical protein MNSN_10460 [Candidatus Parcubacteria bacterium]